MNFNYVCELKTANGMAGTMAFGDLLENCMCQRLIEQYNAPEYERVQLLHELSGLYSEAYENTTLFFGEEPVEVRFFGVPGGDEDDFMLNAVTRLEDGRCFLFSADDDFMQSYRIKVMNTINFAKSMHYNPLAYIRSEKDILKLVNCLIANTRGEGKGGDPFWDSATRSLTVCC